MLMTQYFYSRYLFSDDCSISYQFVCETVPLNVAPDYPCPKGFYPFKAECLNPNQVQLDYDTSVVRK